MLTAAALAALALELPLACAPGADCWISSHFDQDAGPRARDYACGVMTYNGHNGTDFALRDLAAMRAGVAVVAAAAGTVAAVRDGVAERNVRKAGENSVKGVECGNGVRIDHGGGWQTQYCHLRRGSVAVRRGERVAAGQPLGEVGLSGLTEYPHLHFSVRRQGVAVDPFRPDAHAAGCGAAQPLWSAHALAALGYAPGALYNFGVATRMPRPDEVRSGLHAARSLDADAPALVLWAEAFGARAGDRLRLVLEAPDGKPVFERTLALERDQARIFRAFGRKRGAAAWPAGRYRATIALERPATPSSPPAAARFEFEIR
jgi:hypothetical protein